MLGVNIKKFYSGLLNAGNLLNQKVTVRNRKDSTHFWPCKVSNFTLFNDITKVYLNILNYQKISIMTYFKKNSTLRSIISNF